MAGKSIKNKRKYSALKQRPVQDPRRAHFERWQIRQPQGR
jgi:hypothetical protein